MSRRIASSWVASILLVSQLVTAPFTHAGPMTAGDPDCAGMHEQRAYATTDRSGDCCAQAPHHTDHCDHASRHHRPHAACSCPCGHTPSLAATSWALPAAGPSEFATGSLASATPDPPLSRLLRPPA